MGEILAMIISAGLRKGAMGALLMAGLASCSSTSNEQDTTFVGTVRETATELLKLKDKEEAAAATPKSPEEMAAEALRVNPGPLILVGLEKAGLTQVLALTGQNGSLRTYMTPNEQSIVLRNGMLVATRGLGHDLSVAEPGTEAAIRAGASSQGQRIMRYLTGNGLETPLLFECTTGPGPNAGVVVENCSGHGLEFQNSYLPQGGQIPVSRQWIGPNLGYITIQTLRP